MCIRCKPVIGFVIPGWVRPRERIPRKNGEAAFLVMGTRPRGLAVDDSFGELVLEILDLEFGKAARTPPLPPISIEIGVLEKMIMGKSPASIPRMEYAVNA